MPPSGFSQKAINGLLEFVKANYELVHQKKETSSLSEDKFLVRTIRELENRIKETAGTTLATDAPATTGLLLFIVECYKDLLSEIMVGEDKHGRSVLNGQAIEKELTQIGDYLERFTI